VLPRCLVAVAVAAGVAVAVGVVAEAAVEAVGLKSLEEALVAAVADVVVAAGTIDRKPSWNRFDEVPAYQV